MGYLAAGLAGSALTALILGIAAWLAKSWISARLKASIKHEYDTRLLDLESQKEVRLKGEVVADLLAEWIRRGGKLDYHQLNRLSFQAFIWLPKDLAKELSDLLAHEPGAQDVRQLVRNVRIYLQGTDDGFEARDVIVFNEPDIYGQFHGSHVTSEARVKPKPKTY